MREIDSWQEAAQRHIKKVMARKRDAPTEEDIAKLNEYLDAMADAVMAFGGILGSGYPI